jgi:hypothetical protein
VRLALPNTDRVVFDLAVEALTLAAEKRATISTRQIGVGILVGALLMWLLAERRELRLIGTTDSRRSLRAGFTTAGRSRSRPRPPEIARNCGPQHLSPDRKKSLQIRIFLCCSGGPRATAGDQLGIKPLRDCAAR